jgi:galactokinase
MSQPDSGLIRVPGRVNLIGEHIDYHNLAVLPMALSRRVEVRWRARSDSTVRAASSSSYHPREFTLAPDLKPWPSGDWGNYVKAAANAAQWKWTLARGADLEISSDLPSAAGLSSSSALLTACTLALLAANGILASFEELMEVLPEGEYFVGTRGGGMDHAAVLAARSGCALLVEFAPARTTPVPVPAGWSFLVAHSLTHAEKSGAVREEYNERRWAGARGLHALGYQSFREALEAESIGSLTARAASLPMRDRECFLHVATEAVRVRQAVEAMRAGDQQRFGQLLNESHASARDQLRISTPALDRLTQAARDSGALGARLTGAGFGGCAVIFCLAPQLGAVRAGLTARFYNGDAAGHILEAVPSPGALELTSTISGSL